MLSSVHITPNSPHAWALATTAMIFEMNSHRHDLLAGTVATPDGEKTGKRLLSQGWDVNNRDDLLRTLTWLQFKGHRTEFDQLGVQVDALTEQQFLTVEAAAQSNPRALNQLEITLKNYRALGTKGILAWDLVRYIAGVSLGDISPVTGPRQKPGITSCPPLCGCNKPSLLGKICRTTFSSGGNTGRCRRLRSKERDFTPFMTAYFRIQAVRGMPIPGQWT